MTTSASRALVIYESMFGNGQAVAKAIADGLGRHIEASAVEVGEAPVALERDVAFLVVGGPNHGTGMSTAKSREQAGGSWEASIVSSGIGLRDWFDLVLPPAKPIRAVAYDTRLAKPFFMRWLDRCSRGIESRLRAHGFVIASPAEHFFVTGPHGPLAEGELDRARRWGELLAMKAPVVPQRQ